MAHLVQDASASIHPSVFSTREASIIKKALNLIESKRLRDQPVLYYYDDFERYLMLRFAGLTNEQGHVLYLNINRELLAAETEFFGHQSCVSWDIRHFFASFSTAGKAIPSSSEKSATASSISRLEPLCWLHSQTLDMVRILMAIPSPNEQCAASHLSIAEALHSG